MKIAPGAASPTVIFDSGPADQLDAAPAGYNNAVPPWESGRQQQALRRLPHGEQGRLHARLRLREERLHRQPLGHRRSHPGRAPRGADDALHVVHHLPRPHPGRRLRRAERHDDDPAPGQRPDRPAIASALDGFDHVCDPPSRRTASSWRSPAASSAPTRWSTPRAISRSSTSTPRARRSPTAARSCPAAARPSPSQLHPRLAVDRLPEGRLQPRQVRHQQRRPRRPLPRRRGHGRRAQQLSIASGATLEAKNQHIAYQPTVNPIAVGGLRVGRLREPPRLRQPHGSAHQPDLREPQAALGRRRRRQPPARQGPEPPRLLAARPGSHHHQHERLLALEACHPTGAELRPGLRVLHRLLPVGRDGRLRLRTAAHRLLGDRQQCATDGDCCNAPAAKCIGGFCSQGQPG